MTSSGGTVSSSASGATTGGIVGRPLRGLTVAAHAGADQRAGASRPTASASPATRSRSTSTRIPLSAIERVEVLKDGASAIYGSDAIAGVVNFILRKDYHGAAS